MFIRIYTGWCFIGAAALSINAGAQETFRADDHAYRSHTDGHADAHGGRHVRALRPGHADGDAQLESTRSAKNRTHGRLRRARAPSLLFCCNQIRHCYQVQIGEALEVFDVFGYQETYSVD